MATIEERLDLALQIIRGSWHPDINRWPENFSEEDQRGVIYLVTYEADRRKTKYCKKRRKAGKLLRSWLNPRQLTELRRSQRFYVFGSTGGIYRILPSMGMTERVALHGKYYYRVSTFCYHDDANELPPADISLAHMLMIQTDEPGFLAVANEHPHRSSQWDGAWKRQLNQARREREHQAA